MIVTFEVGYVSGETATAHVSIVSQVAFEEAFDRPAVAMLLAKPPQLRHVTWMCWHALHGDTGQPAYKEWLAQVDSVTFVRVGDPVPLETSQPTG